VSARLNAVSVRLRKVTSKLYWLIRLRALCRDFSQTCFSVVRLVRRCGKTHEAGESVGVGVWGGSLCTAVAPTCIDKEAGSNGVGFSMDTRLPCPKEMNGLKILSSTRLLVQTHLPTTHQPSRRLHHHSDAQLGQLTHPHPQSSPSSEQQVHSKVFLRRAVDAV
jgi:hypothetical protein